METLFINQNTSSSLIEAKRAIQNDQGLELEDVPVLMAEINTLISALMARNWDRRKTDPNSSDLSQLLTVEEVADKLRLTKQYVYELTRTGQLPCVRKGKYVRVCLSDLLAWIDKHRDGVLDRKLRVA